MGPAPYTDVEEVPDDTWLRVLTATAVTHTRGFELNPTTSGRWPYHRPDN